MLPFCRPFGSASVACELDHEQKIESVAVKDGPFVVKLSERTLPQQVVGQMARRFTLSRTDRGSDASAPAERAHGAGGGGNFSEPMNDDPAGFRQWLAADRVVRAPNGELVNSFEPLPRERTQPEEIGLHVRRIASTATGCVSGTSLKETQNKDAIGYLAAVVGKPLAFEKAAQYCAGQDRTKVSAWKEAHLQLWAALHRPPQDATAAAAEDTPGWTEYVCATTDTILGIEREVQAARVQEANALIAQPAQLRHQQETAAARRMNELAQSDVVVEALLKEFSALVETAREVCFIALDKLDAHERALLEYSPVPVGPVNEELGIPGNGAAAFQLVYEVMRRTSAKVGDLLERASGARLAHDEQLTGLLEDAKWISNNSQYLPNTDQHIVFNMFSTMLARQLDPDQRPDAWIPRWGNAIDVQRRLLTDMRNAQDLKTVHEVLVETHRRCMEAASYRNARQGRSGRAPAAAAIEAPAAQQGKRQSRRSRARAKPAAAATSDNPADVSTAPATQSSQTAAGGEAAKNSTAPATCLNCGKKGHTWRQCTAPNSGLCWECGQKGHVRWNCPKRQNAQQADPNVETQPQAGDADAAAPSSSN